MLVHGGTGVLFSQSGSCRLHSCPVTPHRNAAQQNGHRLAICHGLAPGPPAQDAAVPDPTPSQPPAPASPAPASKGFGIRATPPARPKGKQEPLKKVMQQGPRKPTTPGGRIDVVQVQDWGSGNQAEWGDLKVKNVETLYGDASTASTASSAAAGTLPDGATASGGSNQEGGVVVLTAAVPAGGQGAVRPAQGSVPAGPFYEQLCQELAMAEKRGALAVAGPAPPPFKAWSFTPARYVQYLTDCLTVHQALELALTTTSPATTPTSPQSSPTSPGLLHTAQCIHAAGLARSAALSHDLKQVCLQNRIKQAPTPSTMAQTHASQLQRLGRDVATWAAAAGATTSTETTASGSDRKLQEELQGTGEAAAAVLVAQGFAIYSLHAAGGMRFGAAAAEKLSLLQHDAARFYRTYPDTVKEPLISLRFAMDTGGKALSSEARRQVVDVLPDAVRNASQLLSALAHTD